MTNASPRVRDGMYYAAFLLVELFAALEVTAMLVAAPAASARMGGLGEGLMLNSYLYPVFGCMVLFIFLNAAIQRRCSALGFLLWGLALFVAGNIVCAVTSSQGAFLLGRAVQGVGAAAAFAGQLWTAGEHYRRTITRPMFFGECGAAVGIVIGPLVGGFLAGISPESWRLIFVLNAGLGVLTAGLSLAALAGRTPPEHDDSMLAVSRFGGSVAALIVAQLTVSALAVGMEFCVSDYLQNVQGRGPLFVGLLTLAASVGAIVGSYAVMALDRGFARLARAGVWLMIAAVIAVGMLLADRPEAAAVPIFAVGVALGMAQMAIYAQLVAITPQERFVLISLIYLLAMQLGNALGIQGIELAGLVASSPFRVLTLLSLPCAVFALWFSLRAPLPAGGPAGEPAGETAGDA